MKNNINTIIENEYQDLILKYNKHFNNFDRHGSYLFTGPARIGKKYIAKLFAKSLICNQDVFIDCDCDDCTDIDRNLHGDVINIDVGGICDLTDSNHRDHSDDGSKKIRICQIKRIERLALLSPSRSKTKIFIVNNLDLMTDESANALLKTLEDAPHSSVFLLLTNNLERVAQTVKSRCHILNIDPINSKALQSLLVKLFSTDEINAEDIVKLSRSKLNAAKDFFSNEECMNLFKQAIDDIEKIISFDPIQRLEYAEKFNILYRKQPENFFQIIMYWEDWFRWHLYKINELDCAPSFLSKYYAFEVRQIFYTLQALLNVKNELKMNVSPLLSLEVFLLGLPKF